MQSSIDLCFNEPGSPLCLSTSTGRRYAKVRVLSNLITVIADRAERKFCDYLEQRLFVHRRYNRCTYDPLIFGTAEEAASETMSLDRYHFSQAIAYLDKHIRNNRKLYEIAEESLRIFRNRIKTECKIRDESQIPFDQMLDTMVPPDDRLDVKMTMYSELNSFDKIKRLLSNTRRNIQLMDATEEGIENINELVEHMVAELCIIMPLPVPFSNPWMMMRNEAIQEMSLNVIESLTVIHYEVERQKKRFLQSQYEYRSETYGSQPEIFDSSSDRAISMSNVLAEQEMESGSDKSDVKDSEQVVRFSPDVRVIRY